VDVRAARDVVALARWWTSATEEARFALWLQATRENTPDLRALQLAVYLAETEAGEVAEG
jgi:hypothetical protein